MALAQLGNYNQQFLREEVGLITGPGGWELFPDGFMKHAGWGDARRLPGNEPPLLRCGNVGCARAALVGTRCGARSLPPVAPAALSVLGTATSRTA